MLFHETGLAGAYLIEPEPHHDERGLFGRLLCRDELAAHGLETEIVQSNVGFSHTTGTLRGLHFQRPPHAEVKIVRCTRGSVYDVIVDLRTGSPTFRRWYGVELTDRNRRMIYVPRGFAQGYLTLCDEAEICYHTSQRYDPPSTSGVRWDDPAFRIAWPAAVRRISDQDRAWPDFDSREPPFPTATALP
jgi:dTDP-4-dehydrorhamnose 3,5-epimerase